MSDTDEQTGPEQELGPQDQDAELEQVIDRLGTEHGFDVRGYKRSTLYRRIRKRIADAGCDGVDDYLVRLETDGPEYEALVNVILINVSEFFRDPDAWDAYESECLKPLLARRPEGTPYRAWCVGCATGEEPYSLAILLAEHLGECSPRDVKIYATDVDEGALAAARAGVYGPEDLRNVSPERLERFFEELPGGRYAIRREVRSCVIFGRHNILTDPPISHLHTLICRNLLIYFDTATQQSLLPRFHYALQEEGYLFLGKAETLMARSLLFRALEPRHRLFQRLPQIAPGGLSGAFLEARRPPQRDGRGERELHSHLLQSLVEQAACPVVVLDATGLILMASSMGRAAYRISEALLGRNFVELDDAVRPPLLRLALEEARTTGRAVTVEEVILTRPNGMPFHLRVDVRPILDARGEVTHLVLWGSDTTDLASLQDELVQARQDLETTREELNTTNEELETSNEELQSSNEELETTNEELQSTNEELETTVEELQSTNEELETANDELRMQQESLNLLSDHQAMVLSGLQMGLIVLDQNGVVTGWNSTSEETWGVRVDEAVGQEVFSLDIGLDLEALREPVRRATQGESPAESLKLDAVNRRGRTIRCLVRVQPLHDESQAVIGTVVIVDQALEWAMGSREADTE